MIEQIPTTKVINKYINNMVEQLLVNGTENNSFNMNGKHQLFIIIRIYPTST